MRSFEKLVVAGFGLLSPSTMMAMELPERPSTVLYPKLYCKGGDMVSGSGPGLFFADIYDQKKVTQIIGALEKPENLGARYGGVVRVEKKEGTKYVTVGFMGGHADQNGEYHDAAGHILKRTGYSAQLDLYGGTSPRPEDRGLILSLTFDQCKDVEEKEVFHETQTFKAESGEDFYLQVSYTWTQPNASGGKTVALADSKLSVFTGQGTAEDEFQAFLRSDCTSNVTQEFQTFKAEAPIEFAKKDFDGRLAFRGTLSNDEVLFQASDYRGYGLDCTQVFELSRNGEMLINAYTGTSEFPFKAPRIFR